MGTERPLLQGKELCPGVNSALCGEIRIPQLRKINCALV